MAKPPEKPVLQLVNELGGAKAVAEALKTKERTVHMWAYRKGIPRARWPEMIDAFPGVTLDRLRAVERAA